MFKKVKISTVGYIFFGLGLLYFCFVTLIGGDKAIKIEPELRSQFNMITPLSGVKQYDSYSIVKDGLVSLNWLYESTVPFSEVYKHYNKELEKNGWRYHMKQEEKDGTVSYYFKKEDYYANITTFDNYHFRFNLRWAMLGN